MAVLSTSAQSHKEVFTISFPKVFTLQTAFRRDGLRKGNMHLDEFTLLEIELRGDMSTAMKALERILATTLDAAENAHLVSRHQAEAASAIPYRRIDYQEWRKEGTRRNLREFAFVTHWPRRIKSDWYYASDPSASSLALTFDLVSPTGVELASGGQRVSDIEDLLRNSRDLPDYWKPPEWYVRLIRQGMMPMRSGCALGIDRVLCWALRLEDMRDAVPFPRTRETLDWW